MSENINNENQQRAAQLRN